jgi:hypothetical protein
VLEELFPKVDIGVLLNGKIIAVSIPRLAKYITTKRHGLKL